jgi:cyclic pyranopterin phosphate synthase
MKEKSKITMINISEKPEIMRTAVAEGKIKLKKGTVEAIKKKRIKKGDVFTCAKLAGINAVKKTSDLIFLAHPIPITYVNVSLKIDEKESELKSAVEVRSLGRTGVELEAILGVMTTLLTVFDMCKYLEKDEYGQYQVACISDIKVVKKIKVV